MAAAGRVGRDKIHRERAFVRGINRPGIQRRQTAICQRNHVIGKISDVFSHRIVHFRPLNSTICRQANHRDIVIIGEIVRQIIETDINIAIVAFHDLSIPAPSEQVAVKNGGRPEQRTGRRPFFDNIMERAARAAPAASGQIAVGEPTYGRNVRVVLIGDDGSDAHIGICAVWHDRHARKHLRGPLHPGHHVEDVVRQQFCLKTAVSRKIHVRKKLSPKQITRRIDAVHGNFTVDIVPNQVKTAIGQGQNLHFVQPAARTGAPGDVRVAFLPNNLPRAVDFCQKNRIRHRAQNITFAANQKRPIRERKPACGQGLSAIDAREHDFPLDFAVLVDFQRTAQCQRIVHRRNVPADQ